MQKTACKEGSAAASGGPAPLLQRHDTATPQSSWMSRRMTPRDSERQENEHEGQNSKATATTTTATATARKESVTGRRPGLTLGSRRRTASREEDLPASSSSVTIKENANVTPSVQETAEREEAAPGSTRRPSYSRNEADTSASVEAGAEVRDGKLASNNNNNRSQTTVTQLSVRHGPSLSLGSGGTVADHLKTLLRKASEEGVTKLDLSSQGITHLPSEIKLPAETLEELNLESNFLQSLPYEIGSLHNLDSLFLQNNRLTDLPLETGTLTNLTRLFLDYNKLTSLPIVICRLRNLVWLSLEHNQLTGLPSSLLELRKLSWLSLEGNQLKSLPDEIGRLTSLVFLSVYDNEELKELPPGLLSLPNLVDFRSNQQFVLPQTVTRAGPPSLVLYLSGLVRVGATLDATASTRHWVPDSEMSACQACDIPFTKLTRRHHCRLCGLIFCHKCAAARCTLPLMGFVKAERVCVDCLPLLTAYDLVSEGAVVYGSTTYSGSSTSSSSSFAAMLFSALPSSSSSASTSLRSESTPRNKT